MHLFALYTMWLITLPNLSDQRFFCYATAMNCCKWIEYRWIVPIDIFLYCCLLCHGICCLLLQDEKAFVFGEWAAEAFANGDDIMSVMLRIVSELTLRRSCDSGRSHFVKGSPIHCEFLSWIKVTESKSKETFFFLWLQMATFR